MMGKPKLWPKEAGHCCRCGRPTQWANCDQCEQLVCRECQTYVPQADLYTCGDQECNDAAAVRAGLQYRVVYDRDIGAAEVVCVIRRVDGKVAEGRAGMELGVPEKEVQKRALANARKARFM